MAEKGITDEIIETIFDTKSDIAAAIIVLIAGGFLAREGKKAVDKYFIRHGIKLDTNIKDIIEPTAWPTGVINPETGNEFKEFRIRRTQQSATLDTILGNNTLLKKYAAKAFNHAKKLDGESDIGLFLRKLKFLFNDEVMPVNPEKFILLENLIRVIPKSTFRKDMDRFEAIYRSNLGALFDDDELQELDVGERDYRMENYAIPVLMLDPTNGEMRIAMYSNLAITQRDYFPLEEDCVVRLPPGRELPEEAKPENGGYHFTVPMKSEDGVEEKITFYRAPKIDRFQKLFSKAPFYRKVTERIQDNPELFNFSIGIPTDHVAKIDEPKPPGA